MRLISVLLKKPWHNQRWMLMWTEINYAKNFSDSFIRFWKSKNNSDEFSELCFNSIFLVSDLRKMVFLYTMRKLLNFDTVHGILCSSIVIIWTLTTLSLVPQFKKNIFDCTHLYVKRWKILLLINAINWWPVIRLKKSFRWKKTFIWALRIID